MTSFKICWSDLTLPPINLWNVPMANINYTAPCPNCKRTKTYKTENTYKKCKDKLCKSCSNSFIRGGNGFTKFCSCGNPKYDKSSTLCIVCHNKRSHIYHVQTYRFKKYGVTRDWYEEEVKKGCAICGKHLEANSKTKRERGHIDHNHETNKARGVLCDLCNKGLGQFKDSINNLEKAIKYLKERN